MDLPSIPANPIEQVRQGVVGGLAQTADRYAMWSELLRRFGFRYAIDPVQITQATLEPYVELDEQDAHTLFPPAVAPSDVALQPQDSLIDDPNYRALWLPRELREPDPLLEREDFSFPSSHRGKTPAFRAQLKAFPNNATVHGRIYRARGTRPKRAIVFAHGFLARGLDGIGLLTRADVLASRDLAVVAIELPHHAKRTTPGRFSGELFLSGDIVRSLESVLQAVADLRTTVAWLREEMGVDRVGLFGGSLGGYLCTLAAAFERDLDLLFAIAPPIRLTDNIGKLPLGHYMEAGLRAQEIPEGVLAHLQDLVDPSRYSPALATSRMRFIAGQNDLFVPEGHLRRLEQHWPGIEIDWHPWGHTTAFIAWPPARLFPELVRWIDGLDDPSPALATRSAC